jgi:hypothetical protein
MKKILVFALTGMMIVSVSCKKKDMVPGTYKSNEVHMGNGKVHSWMTFNEEGTPVSLGFSLDDAALTGLPEASGGGGHNHSSIELPLPPEIVSITPWNHIVIDWNPAGHGPPPYLSPHFDFHFYSITSADRKAIPVYTASPNTFNKFPGYDYFPTNYFCPGDTNTKAPTQGGPRALGDAAEPQMGYHWIDITSKELQPGGVFTETFVYGSYNGKMNFIEPMVTHAFFQGVTSWSRSIPQAAKVQKSGYYPTTLSITHANGMYTLALENLVFRTAS